MLTDFLVLFVTLFIKKKKRKKIRTAKKTTRFIVDIEAKSKTINIDMTQVKWSKNADNNSKYLIHTRNLRFCVYILLMDLFIYCIDFMFNVCLTVKWVINFHLLYNFIYLAQDGESFVCAGMFPCVCEAELYHLLCIHIVKSAQVANA